MGVGVCCCCSVVAPAMHNIVELQLLHVGCRCEQVCKGTIFGMAALYHSRPCWQLHAPAAVLLH
jgi:hypothetical protein